MRRRMLLASLVVVGVGCCLCLHDVSRVGRAQAQTAWWSCTPENDTWQEDERYAGRLTSPRALEMGDDGFLILGGDGDLQLLKTDEEGWVSWANSYSEGDAGTAYSVCQTEDGGYVLLGEKVSCGGAESCLWLVKTHEDGEFWWDETYGELGRTSGRCVLEASEGGYLLAGETEDRLSAGGTDIWLVKTSKRGVQLDEARFGGERDESCVSVRQAQDGDYVVLGYTESYGGGAAWLFKTDSSGERDWEYTFGEQGSVFLHSFERTGAGGYILVGEKTSSAGDKDVCLIKVAADGKREWMRDFGGSGEDRGWTVRQTADGGYAVLASTDCYGDQGSGIWLIRTDCFGKLVWEEFFPGKPAPGDGPGGPWLQLTPDGGYVILSRTGDGPWLTKYCPELERRPVPVYIPDPGLAQSVSRDLDIPSDGTITSLAMAALESLEAPECGIQDLTGLEHAVSLRYVNLAGNQISDISSLLVNPGLGEGDTIDLSRNQLDLSPGSAALRAIMELLNRGVQVRYDHQKGQ